MYSQMMQRDDFVIYGYGYDSATEPEQLQIDNQLGRGIAEGDVQAFDLFVSRWRGYVVRYVRRRLSYYSDMADAQEIANDVFLHLTDASKKWLLNSRYAHVDFVRFFYGVMRLQTTWKLQKVGKRRKRAARDHTEFARISRTIENFDFVGFDDALADALLALKPKTRLAFILRHIEGYRTNEVARILDLSAACATYHDKKACRRLRKLLADWN